MPASIDFYLTRARESAKAAEETKLIKVQERCLRAEAAWRTMADRLIEVEAKKQQDAQDKAQRQSEQTSSSFE